MPSKKTRSLFLALAAMPLLTLFGCGSSAAWEPDDRYENVPLYAGQPMQAERAGMGFSGSGYQVRLKARQSSKALRSEDVDAVASRLLKRYRGEMAKYSGVRDERYFLISIQPDVMVVAPFVYKIPRKTAAQMKGLSGDFNDKVLNPLYEELKQQQEGAQQHGLGEGWFSRLPGPNFAELGCSFPDLPGAVLWAPALGSERPFDEAARKLTADKLKISAQRHPRIPGHWQLVGCTT